MPSSRGSGKQKDGHSPTASHNDDGDTPENNDDWNQDDGLSQTQRRSHSARGSDDEEMARRRDAQPAPFYLTQMHDVQS